ncbi:DNA-dependent protein kinase catalytic subunit [Gigaspora margarita]|uniref:DNA-dependent protein kinase catalytic subunit n=1 Tax=Gigaspora margarita TaxID=4874 RepID=A0A8H4B0Z9_GIGMA|nr:DNA-dependent protein kinase catalytic subunit [Gigaspora margarita]
MDNSLKEIAQVRADALLLKRGIKTVEQARKQKIKDWINIKILQLLGTRSSNTGRLGGTSKLIFERIVNNETTTILQQKIHGFKHKTSNNLLTWDPEKRLIFNIPYPDINVEISIDEFFPYIVELAESTPDRKTKVFACELLNSITLLMIGKSAFQARSTAGPQKV